MNSEAPPGSTGRTVRVQIPRALQCLKPGSAASTTLEGEDKSDISASSVDVHQDRLRFGSAVSIFYQRVAALTALVEEFCSQNCRIGQCHRVSHRIKILNRVPGQQVS